MNNKPSILEKEMYGVLVECINALYEAYTIAPLDRRPGLSIGAFQNASAMVDKYETLYGKE